MRRSGFSLVELLVAATITLVVLLAAAQVFWMIGSNVANSRGLMEASSRLRSAQFRLQADLDGMTAWGITPPADPANDIGYVEIIEGPGPWFEVGGDTFALGARPVKDGAFDSSVGDVDDVIMFTTRSYGEPFTGRWMNDHAQSPVAEVAWFVRGNKLYRRQLLVLANRDPISPPANYYNVSDVSVRAEGGPTDSRTGWFTRARQLTPNTLGDLTKRENRFAHQPCRFPHDASFWGQLGLPTLQEMSDPDWPFPAYPGADPDAYVPIDGWVDSAGNFPFVDQRDFWYLPVAGLPVSGEALAEFKDGPRAYEDVILTNVISFDVKVYDPVAPIFGQEITDSSGEVISVEPVLPGDPLHKLKMKNGNVPLDHGGYVDLFYRRGTGADWDTPFAGPGQAGSGLEVTDEARQPATYCTWSSHYNNDGLDQFGDGSVDDPNTPETVPPYPFKLLGLQITIRVFDPDSGQIKQVTVRRSGSR